MPKKAPEAARRYLMIEIACKERKCSPCTYPNCQRYVRELPRVEGLKTKMLEIDHGFDKKIRAGAEKPRGIDRYVLVELSCKERKCSPCTYPNCQRFVREKKFVKTKAGLIMKVTELRRDKHLGEVMAE